MYNFRYCESNLKPFIQWWATLMKHIFFFAKREKEGNENIIRIHCHTCHSIVTNNQIKMMKWIVMLAAQKKCNIHA